MSLAVLNPETQLYDYQRPFFNSLARSNLAIFSRQVGKDHTAAMRGVKRLLSGWGNQYVFAPTERQSLEHFDKAKSAFEQYVECAHLQLEIEGVDEEREKNEKEGILLAKSLRLSNGLKYVVMPGRAESARGGSGCFVITEFAFFDRQRDFWRAVMPYITAPSEFPKVVDVITTPNGKGDLVWQWWSENYIEKTSTARSCFFCDIHTAAKEWERLGLLVEPYETAEKYVAFIRENCDSQETFAQEYECEFLDTANAIFGYDLIAKCESEKARRVFDFSILDKPSARFYMGVDIGRKKDLTAIWILEEVGRQLVTRGVIELERTAFSEQAQMLSRLLSSPAIRRCRIDATGLGMQLAETMRERFGSWRVDECTFTQKFKMEIFEGLRAKMDSVNVLIPCAREIREDLRAIQKVTTSRGNASYYAPRNADGHSDRAVALALAASCADSNAPALAFADVEFLGRKYNTYI